MHLHELRDIKLWFLNDLHLSDGAIFEWIDSLSLLLDLLANGLSDEILDEISQLAL